MTGSTKQLVCPSCGWGGSTEGQHDGWFRYLEEVTNERRVEGFTPDGRLLIAAEDHIAIEDDGVNHRLICGNCLTEFPMPEGLEIELG